MSCQLGGLLEQLKRRWLDEGMEKGWGKKVKRGGYNDGLVWAIAGHRCHTPEEGAALGQCR